MMLAIGTLVLALQGPLLTLERAIETAEAHQPEIRQSRAESDAADSRANEARAPLFPQIMATASYQRTTGNRVYRVGTDPRLVARQQPPNSQLWDFFNVGVTATQLVYDFGQTTGRLRAAEATAKSQKATERATRLSVAAGVRVSFFAALAQKQLVTVARETVDNQKRHLDQVEAFVRAKARPEIDLAQARLDMANAEYQLIGSEGAYEMAKAQLNQAMGVETGTEYEIADAPLGTIEGEDASTDALLAEATNARPEFASLAELTRAEEALVSVAKGGYGPALSVGAGASEAGMALDHLRWNYYGSVTLSWPLFQGMLTPARVSEGRANLAVVRARLDALRQQVRLDIERARVGVRSAKSALGTANRALENANERLRLAEARYAAGVGNAIELGDAILARASAAALKIQSEYFLASARAALLHAVGRS
jgi:outer membrane protein